jgi:alpha-L-fucosidase 2
MKINQPSFYCWCFFACNLKRNPGNYNQKLWYTYPAKYWNSQALHLGNGYFGVSFFGGVKKETFSLTEKSMWTGKPAEGDWQKAGVNPRAKEAIPKIRQAL